MCNPFLTLTTRGPSIFRMEIEHKNVSLAASENLVLIVLSLVD